MLRISLLSQLRALPQFWGSRASLAIGLNVPQREGTGQIEWLVMARIIGGLSIR
jgi:hypothetical protein